jgi:hypothetical protein
MRTGLLSDVTLSCLAAAGWNPSRKVDPRPWIRLLEAEGFCCFDQAEQILASVGGLVLRPPERSDRAFLPQPIRFDPMYIASGEFDRMAEFERLAEEPLFPLACAFDHMMMLIGVSGCTHLGHMGELYLAGQSFEEALNNLVEGLQKPIREGVR